MESSTDFQLDRSRLPIGVFDSGLGGLRVLDRLKEALPHEHFVYLGDTKHMPYGLKSHVEIISFVDNCLRWLTETHHVKMIVVACNTASAVASHLFNQYPDLPFIDPVTPICNWLYHSASFQKVGLMATPATVAANRYQQLLDTLGSSIQLKQISCRGLATVIEEGGVDSPECEALLQEFVSPLITWQMEALVLGCTHYPYAIPQIAKLLPSNIDILDPSVFMALRTSRLLQEHQLRAAESQTGHVDYYVTEAPDRFFKTSGAMPFQHIVMQPPALVEIDVKLAPTSKEQR